MVWKMGFKKHESIMFFSWNVKPQKCLEGKSWPEQITCAIFLQPTKQTNNTTDLPFKS